MSSDFGTKFWCSIYSCSQTAAAVFFFFFFYQSITIHSTFLWALVDKSQFESYLNSLLLLDTTMLGHDWPKLWKSNTLNFFLCFSFLQICIIIFLQSVDTHCWGHLQEQGSTEERTVILTLHIKVLLFALISGANMYLPFTVALPVWHDTRAFRF